MWRSVMMSKTLKIKWVVSPVETGSYASFRKRSWPYAYFSGERIAARISCEVGYRAQLVKEEKNPPLTVFVADYSIVPTKEKPCPWRWVELQQKSPSLAAVKERVLQFYKSNKHFLPKDLRGDGDEHQ
jgi:hypothetical protein